MPRYFCQKKVFFACFLLANLLNIPFLRTQNPIPVFRHLDIENGLSNNYASGIVQDDKGFLWIITQYGLNRYDGRETVHFFHDPSDSTGIRGNNLRGMAVAEDGQLWLGFRNGIDRFDPYTETFAHLDFQGVILALVEDTEKGLWVATKKGLFLLEEEAEEFLQINFSPHPWYDASSEIEIQNLRVGKDRSLWVATNVGAYTIEAKGEMGKWLLPCSEQRSSAGKQFMVYDMVTANEGRNLYVATKDGLFEKDESKNCLVPFQLNGNIPFGNKPIEALALEENGKLWLGLSDEFGIYCIDLTKGEITHLTQLIPDNKLGAYISEIFVDDSGIVWITTNGNGVHIYDPQTSHFKWFGQGYKSREAGSSFLIANEVLEDSKGVKWICTDLGIEWGSYLGEEQYPALKNKLGQIKTGVYEINEAANGIFWLSTMTGAIRINSNNGRIHTYFETPALLGGEEQNNIVTAFCVDRHNNAWMGFWGGGMAFIDHKNPDHPKIFPCQPEDSPVLNGCFLQDIVESKDGTIWIGGSTGEGLLKYNPEKDVFKQYLPDPNNDSSLSNDYVRTILEDNDGKLWLGTFGGGLEFFDPATETFRHFTQKDGLSDDLVFSLVKDNNDCLWVLTATAISKYDPTTGIFQNFDDENGLPKTQYNELSGPGPVSQQIFIGTDQGYVAFHPDSIKIDTVAPKTCIVKMERYRRDKNNGEPILEKGIAYKKEINLDYDDYIVTFELAAITCRKADRAQMAYKLQGFQDDWIQLGSKRQISFTSLPAKEYTLLVKSANADGVWNETPVMLKIRVSPPWWKTWWAFSLYAVTLLSAFWFFSRRELRRIHLQNQLEKEHLERERLEELDQVKSRFLTNISHEFRTPLTVILGMTEEIKESRTAKNLIRKSSENLLRLVNQLLDFGKLEAGKLKIILESGDIVLHLKYLLESFQSLAAHKNVRLIFEPAEEQLIMDFDEEKIQHIVSNLLSNAIKFTPRNGQVTLSVARSGKDAIIQVKDTGIGIAADQLPRIFERFYQISDPMSKGEPGTGIGLTFTKELVELMNGRIEVESEAGVGTVFKVSLPITNSVARSVAFRPAPTPTIEPEAFEPAMVETDSEKPQLLVIEDNPEVVTYIRTILQNEYDIIVAENGEIGIEKALELIPDIIISDVMMPVKDGFAVTCFLKNDERTSHVPIILLTAKADAESRIEGLDRGADAYLAKPFDKVELRLRMKKLIELRKKLQTRYARFTLPDHDAPDVDTQIEDAFLEKVNNIIEANLGEAEFGVAELCRDIGMSRSQLFRKLKALTGKSIVAYLRSVRLHKARELLQTGELNVTEVAFSVGFNDPKYFSRAFSQEFGHAPKDMD